MNSRDVLPNRPAPRQGASLMSWLYALAKANYHRDISHLCSLITDSKKYWGQNMNIKITSEGIQTLSRLTLFSAERIHSLTVHSFATQLCIPDSILKDEKGYPFITQSPHNNMRTSRYTKYCPTCLNEEHFHRVQWDLPIVATCLRHGTLLMEKCSGCGKRISVVEIMRGVHPCGANLASATAETAIQTAGQEYIQKVLKLCDEVILREEPAKKSLLSIPDSLVLPLLEKIAKIVWKRGTRFELPFGHPGIDRSQWAVGKTRRAWLMLPVGIRHITLEAAYAVLQDWPVRFNSFLELLLRESSSGELAAQKFTSDLLLMMEDARLKVVRSEIRAFVKKKSASHWLAKKQILLKTVELDPDDLKSVPINRLTKILRMTRPIVQLLLKNSGINVRTSKSSDVGVQLVSRKDVERLVATYKSKIGIIQVAAWLNIAESDAHDLIVSRKLDHVRVNKYYFVEESTLSTFQQKYINNVAALDSNMAEVLSIEQTGQLLGFLRWAYPKVLHLIDEGILNPIRLRDSKGLASIVFDAAEIRQLSILCDGKDRWLRWQSGCTAGKATRPFLKEKCGREYRLDSYITLSKAAKLVECSFHMVKELGKRNYLELVGRDKRKIPLASFLRFRKKYVSRSEAMRLMDSSRNQLQKYYDAGKLNRIYWKGEKSRNTCYLREEVERFSKNKNNLVSLAETAEILSVKKSTMYGLVAKNRLETAFPSDASGACPRLFFVRKDVEHLKAELAEQVGLKELMEASGLTCSAINQMIKGGNLKPIKWPLIVGYRRLLFKRGDVHEMMRRYNSGDAAVFLGISEAAVRSLARDSMLKAKSGPTVDGSKYYKFRFAELNDFKKYYGGDLTIFVKQGNLHLVDMKVLMKELGVTKNHAWYLIDREFIKPFARVRHCGRRKPLFSRGDIQRAKNKLTKGLLSATDAARELGQDLKTFKNRWVDTGILKPAWKISGIEKMHFRKEDVKRAKTMGFNCVTGPAAAKMLGVHRNIVYKWGKSGKLKAVSGPRIDGFGCNLYARRDIAKLRKERKEVVHA